METVKHQIGARLRELHERAGEPSYAAIHRYMVDSGLGTEGSATDEAIRTWHTEGFLPGRANVEQIKVVADFYGVTLADIHPILARRAESALRVLASVTPIGVATAAGQNWKMMRGAGVRPKSSRPTRKVA